MQRQLSFPRPCAIFIDLPETTRPLPDRDRGFEFRRFCPVNRRDRRRSDSGIFNR